MIRRLAKAALVLAFLRCAIFEPSVALAQGLPSANQVYAGPTSGPPAAPTFRSMVGADLPSGIIANSSLANMAPGTVKCNPFGGSAAAPTDCAYRVINVVDQGADPTGATANFGSAFNTAMALCVSGGNLGIRLNGTVYIPPGFYKLGSTVITWSKGCNIVADPAAYIQANASVTNLLASGVGSSNSLDSVQLIGGQWDCNGNVTQDGFKIPDFARVRLKLFRMYGCSGNAGNGSIGGFIRLGGASTSQSFEMHIEDAFLYNFGSTTPTIVTGNYGIFSDPSSSTGPTDSRFSNIEVVGAQIGFQGKFFDGNFVNDHVYVFPSQGNLLHGFQITSGQARLIGNQVDGPLASANAAYDLSASAGNANYTMVANGYLESTNNNVSSAVNLGTSTFLFSYGNNWIGSSVSNKILTDYTGTLTNLSVLGDYNSNVSTVVGGAWKTYAPAPSCGTATFTINSAHFNTVAKTTNVQLDVSVSALGTCTSQGLIFTLPNTTASGAGMTGRDVIGGGAGNLVCSVSTGSTSAFCAMAASAIGTSRFVLSGVYENQ